MDKQTLNNLIINTSVRDHTAEGQGFMFGIIITYFDFN